MSSTTSNENDIKNDTTENVEDVSKPVVENEDDNFAADETLSKVLSFKGITLKRGGSNKNTPKKPVEAEKPVESEAISIKRVSTNRKSSAGVAALTAQILQDYSDGDYSDSQSDYGINLPISISRVTKSKPGRKPAKKPNENEELELVTKQTEDELNLADLPITINRVTKIKNTRKNVKKTVTTDLETNEASELTLSERDDNESDTSNLPITLTGISITKTGRGRSSKRLADIDKTEIKTESEEGDFENSHLPITISRVAKTKKRTRTIKKSAELEPENSKFNEDNVENNEPENDTPPADNTVTENTEEVENANKNETENPEPAVTESSANELEYSNREEVPITNSEVSDTKECSEPNENTNVELENENLEENEANYSGNLQISIKRVPKPKGTRGRKAKKLIATAGSGQSSDQPKNEELSYSINQIAPKVKRRGKPPKVKKIVQQEEKVIDDILNTEEIQENFNVSPVLLNSEEPAKLEEIEQRQINYENVINQEITPTINEATNRNPQSDSVLVDNIELQKKSEVINTPVFRCKPCPASKKRKSEDYDLNETSDSSKTSNFDSVEDLQNPTSSSPSLAPKRNPRVVEPPSYKSPSDNLFCWYCKRLFSKKTLFWRHILCHVKCPTVYLTKITRKEIYKHGGPKALAQLHSSAVKIRQQTGGIQIKQEVLDNLEGAHIESVQRNLTDETLNNQGSVPVRKTFARKKIRPYSRSTSSDSMINKSGGLKLTFKSNNNHQFEIVNKSRDSQEMVDNSQATAESCLPIEGEQGQIEENMEAPYSAEENNEYLENYNEEMENAEQIPDINQSEGNMTDNNLNEHTVADNQLSLNMDTDNRENVDQSTAENDSGMTHDENQDIDYENQEYDNYTDDSVHQEDDLSTQDMEMEENVTSENMISDGSEQNKDIPEQDQEKEEGKEESSSSASTQSYIRVRSLESVKETKTPRSPIRVRTNLTSPHSSNNSPALSQSSQGHDSNSNPSPTPSRSANFSPNIHPAANPYLNPNNPNGNYNPNAYGMVDSGNHQTNVSADSFWNTASTNMDDPLKLPEMTSGEKEQAEHGSLLQNFLSDASGSRSSNAMMSSSVETAEYMPLDRLSANLNSHVCATCNERFPDAAHLEDHCKRLNHYPSPPQQPQISVQNNLIVNNVIQQSPNPYAQPGMLMDHLTGQPMHQLAQQVQRIQPGMQPGMSPYGSLPPYGSNQNMPYGAPSIKGYPGPPTHAQPPPNSYRMPMNQSQYHQNQYQYQYSPYHHQSMAPPPPHPQNVQRYGMIQQTPQQQPNNQPIRQQTMQQPRGAGNIGIRQSQQIRGASGPQLRGSNPQMRGMLRPPLRGQMIRPQNMQQMRGGQNSIRSQLNSGNMGQQRVLGKRSNETMGPQTMMKRKRQDILLPDRHDDADCHVIAIQQRNEGLPVIQNVEGNVGNNDANTTNSSSGGNKDSMIHLTDSITLSVRNKETNNNLTANVPQKSAANAVANILATRGITVTPAANKNPSSTATASPAKTSKASPAATINLNNAVSIIPTQKNNNFTVPQTPAAKSNSGVERPPRPPTVDLTDDTAATNVHGKPANYKCNLCTRQFTTQEVYSAHMQKHRNGTIGNTRVLPFKCDSCNATYPKIQDLNQHKRIHHKSSVASEIGIPIVDLKQGYVLNRLASIGIHNFIPLSQLNSQGDGYYGIPIVSVEGAKNTNVCNLSAIGSGAVMTLGPVKQIPGPGPGSRQQ